jgi:hypothetical protein
MVATPGNRQIGRDTIIALDRLNVGFQVLPSGQTSDVL